MDKTNKVKRSFYLTQETDYKLNKWVATWCASTNQTAYGVPSNTVDSAISFFTDTYQPETYTINKEPK